MARAKKGLDFTNPTSIDFRYIAALTTAAAKEPLQPVVVHYISDNAGNTTDTAPLEIRVRLQDVNAQLEVIKKRQGPRVEYHDIPSQDTFAAAFDLAQAAR